MRAAMAMPRRLRNASGTLSATATSQRLMNIEATEPTSGLSPAAMRRSMPRRYASAAATYCSRENRSVTLTGTPAKIASSMAGKPSLVPGILMNRLGRPARAESSLAAAMVLTVLCASSGDTSSDTHPSTPFVRS
jgi:Flp pilus assembly protein TadD